MSSTNFPFFATFFQKNHRPQSRFGKHLTRFCQAKINKRQRKQLDARRPRWHNAMRERANASSKQRVSAEAFNAPCQEKNVPRGTIFFADALLLFFAFGDGAASNARQRRTNRSKQQAFAQRGHCANKTLFADASKKVVNSQRGGAGTREAFTRAKPSEARATKSESGTRTLEVACGAAIGLRRIVSARGLCRNHWRASCLPFRFIACVAVLRRRSEAGCAAASALAQAASVNFAQGQGEAIAGIPPVCAGRGGGRGDAPASLAVIMASTELPASARESS